MDCHIYGFGRGLQVLDRNTRSLHTVFLTGAGWNVQTGYKKWNTSMTNLSFTSPFSTSVSRVSHVCVWEHTTMLIMTRRRKKFYKELLIRIVRTSVFSVFVKYDYVQQAGTEFLRHHCLNYYFHFGFNDIKLLTFRNLAVVVG